MVLRKRIQRRSSLLRTGAADFGRTSGNGTGFTPPEIYGAVILGFLIAGFLLFGWLSR